MQSLIVVALCSANGIDIAGDCAGLAVEHYSPDQQNKPLERCFSAKGWTEIIEDLL
jgi:hypothetical protein